MERTPEIFEKIERYLTNRLSADEVVIFENEMADDSELQKEVAKHKAIHHTLSDQETLEIKEKLIKVSKEVKKEESSFTKTLFSSPLRIAATIVVLLGVGTLLWNTIDTTDELRNLYAAHYVPFPAEDITRGEQNTALQSVMNNYNKGAYGKVVKALEKDTNLVGQKELGVYLGTSYLNTDQEQSAILQFENILNTSKYYEASRWYLSLAYLKLKNTQKTKEILEEIIEYKGVYKDNAVRLLNALTE
ncbi:tetratricopeptide repeat protein [Aquimarina sp. 2304DJ70-9]|uniref:tetratricopeptide repeat protein n=1 Tax=Aquimarina penaris TaxID=3231044 RepID=UPI003462CF00